MARGGGAEGADVDRSGAGGQEGEEAEATRRSGAVASGAACPRTPTAKAAREAADLFLRVLRVDGMEIRGLLRCSPPAHFRCTLAGTAQSAVVTFAHRHPAPNPSQRRAV